MGEGLTSRTRRADWLSSQRQYYPIPSVIPEVKEHDVQVEMRDGTFITVRIYTPEVSSVRIPDGGSPVYVAYHEGGWCFGDLTDEEMNCRMVSRECGAVCFNVDYRSAPLSSV
jgi:acetyl esterase/lipase